MKKKAVSLKELTQCLLTSVNAQRLVVMEAIAKEILREPEVYILKLEQLGKRCVAYFKNGGKHTQHIYYTSFPILIEALMQTGKHDLIIDMYCYVYGVNALQDPLTLEAFEKGEMHLRESIDWMSLFKDGFYTWVGKTLERSMNWALQLCELMPSAHVVPSRGEENTQMLSQIILAEELTDALTLPPIIHLPVKRWLEQIMRHVDQEECMQMVRDLLGIQGTLVWRPLSGESHSLQQELDASRSLQIDVFENTLSPEEEKRLLVSYTHETPIQRRERIQKRCIALKQRDAEIYIKQNEQERTRMEAKLLRGRQLGQLIQARSKDIDAASANQLEEIKRAPKRMLRPQKGDFIEVDIPVLRDACLRGIGFDGESGALSEITIELLLREFSPHLVRCRIPLMTLLNEKGRLLADRYADADHLAIFLRAVVIDLLNRIVVRDDDFPPHPGGGSSEGLLQADDPRRRAHLRKLQPGQKASLEARERARLVKFGELPEGYTFVRAIFADNAILHDLPNEPFLHLTPAKLPTHLR